MAPISPGKPSGPPKTRKRPTATTNSHRFEPFSKRIAKLKIDPVHRTKRTAVVDQDEALLHSHFRASLDRWADFHSSQIFTDFHRKAKFLSESLPQLLHHADTVMDVLLEYIGKREELSLEPLLSLLADLAHDLGLEFEKYFERAVTIVAVVAATHESPEVIEWSFTCLGYLFKFLSRLLVSDLRPLLAIMAPYLGKSRQKDFMIRFTAESMSYLLRKAALLYQRNREPLLYAVSFLLESFQSVESERELESYQSGLMTLLSEAMKGVDSGLHSVATDFLSCIIEGIIQHKELHPGRMQMLGGVVINLIHATDAEGFRPLLDLIKGNALQVKDDSHLSQIGVSMRILFLSISTRKGSRVDDWAGVNSAALNLAHVIAIVQPANDNFVFDALTTIAAVMQYSPMTDLLPVMDSIKKLLDNEYCAKHFLTVCTTVNDLGQERFQSLLLPQLRQFIVRRWEDDPVRLCLLLDNLRSNNSISPRTGSRNYLSCPTDWERAIADHLVRWFGNRGEEVDALVCAYAGLGNNIDFPREHDTSSLLIDTLRAEVVDVLTTSRSLIENRDRFIIGQGFMLYVEVADRYNAIDESLWCPLFSASPAQSGIFGVLPFLLALKSYAQLAPRPSRFNIGQCRLIQAALKDNLLNGADDIKLASLEVLQHLVDRNDRWAKEATLLAEQILKTPLDLQTVRQIFMLIRRLAVLQKEGFSHSELGNLLPYFTFGLLATRRGSIAQEICSALAEMCKNPLSEEIVADIAIRWLNQPQGSRLDHQEHEASHNQPLSLTPFQCSNVNHVEAVREAASEKYNEPHRKLFQEFEKTHKIRSSPYPAGARTLALQVLKSIPHVVEKRSRLVIPTLLLCRSNHAAVVSLDESNMSPSSHTLSPEIKEDDWSLSDLKLVLEILGKFTNPEVIYRSADVYNGLLSFLMHGNVDLQTLAVRAIFTWKQAGVRLYEENLLRLLDRKTFRDELTTLFHGDHNQSSIEISHRAELMPVLLRLLLGLMVSRSGVHGEQESKRKATLRVLFRLDDHEVRTFFDIAFGQLAHLELLKNGDVQTGILDYDVIALDQQYGTLKMIESMLETLKTQLAPYAEQILQPVLYCTIRACRHLENVSNNAKATSIHKKAANTRNTRRTGIHCLNMVFLTCQFIEWSKYLPLIFREIVNPRLAQFAIETSQGVSGLLQLFSTWSHSLQMVSFLQEYNDTLLDIVGECLTVRFAKDEVKIFVLDQIILKICQLAEEEKVESNVARKLLHAHTESLATQLTLLLTEKPKLKVLDSAICVLARLTRLTHPSNATPHLLASLVLMLKEPGARINPRTKGEMLEATKNLLDLHFAELEAGLVTQIFELVSSLFNYFKDNANRINLSETITILASNNVELRETAQICADLNAQSLARLDGADYDRRLKAFDVLCTTPLDHKTASHWQPILYNLLFFSRTEEDFAIHRNSVASLRKFVEISCQSEKADYLELIRKILLPAFKKGVKEDSESIRADHVSLFGLVVQNFPNAPELADMKGLLVGNDEEASFFSNILHIQQHRRLRAIRRLVIEVESGAIESSNICTFFLPLLEKFIFSGDTDDSANNLKGQAIIAIGSLLEWVEWNQFRATFRRYKNYMDSKSLSEKDIAKLMAVAADALSRAASQNGENKTVTDTGAARSVIPSLARSLPGPEGISGELTANFIPQLMAFIHHKDEAQISLRIPIALTTIKLLKILPRDQMTSLLPPVILDISHILRSRVQESRDIARNTLASIVVLLGPLSVEYVLKEMRTSLARGYQLHVLSYTLHTILVASAPHISPGDLDYCVSSLVAVVVDDIFGATGQEKEAEEYVSKMKEVKSSKSFDSMEILAKVTTVRHLNELVRPLQTLLVGTLTSKQSRHADELLRRIGLGLSRNPASGNRDLLTFSYQVIQTIYQQNKGVPMRTMTNDETNRARFLVQLSESNKISGPPSSRHLFKLARFALDLLRSILQKHETLAKPENVHGILPIIGDAIVQPQEEIKTSGFRLLSIIIKLPMHELDENAPLYVLEAVKTVKGAITTNAESAQAALKLVAAILRERSKASIRESDLSYLLHRIMPDLEEPDRQGVTFNLVKAVMARKPRIVVPEIYEVADKIGIMMVTNHTPSTRNAARSVYAQFIVEYRHVTTEGQGPSGRRKSRWTKQLRFLAKNLEYKHPEGRQSVMEAVHILLNKFRDEDAKDIIYTFFFPLALLIANDENAQCRELAAALLGQLFTKARADHLGGLLKPLRSWIQQSENLALCRMGMRAYQVLFENSAINVEKEVALVRSSIYDTLKRSLGNTEDESREAIFQSFQLFSKLCGAYPASTMTPKCALLWSSICVSLSHPHPWVQASAATLIGTWFQDLARKNAEIGYGSLPLTGSFGLRLEASTMMDILRASLRSLRRNWSNNGLATQTVQNLAFLGRCCNENSLMVDAADAANTDDVGEEKGGEEMLLQEPDDLGSSQSAQHLPAISHIFHQLAAILRREPPKLKAQSLAPKRSAVQLLRALCLQSSLAIIRPCLQSMLLPLHHLTDPSIPAPRTADEEFQIAYRNLVEGAQGVQETLQKRLGSAEYVKAMTEVAKAVRERREERRTKRRIEAVADPEAFAKEKRRKNEKKKVRRKEKGVEFRGKRRGW